jgi:hypothetical protein
MEADGLLPCDSLWNLTATTSNSDPVRIEVDSLGASVIISECDDFVSTSSGLFTQAWSDWADTTVVPAVVKADYVDSPVQQCAAKICHGCYCEAEGLGAYLNDEKGLNSYCDAYWENYIGNWALKGMSIIAVILLNALFTTLIPILSRFEKLPSLGELNTSIAIKAYLSAFFNAYVITVRCAALRCAALRCAALRCAALRCVCHPLPCSDVAFPLRSCWCMRTSASWMTSRCCSRARTTTSARRGMPAWAARCSSQPSRRRSSRRCRRRSWAGSTTSRCASASRASTRSAT